VRGVPRQRALGAPRFENKADWGPRIAQGYDTLIKNATAGIRQMPPRGGADLTDTELASAVAYMANAAGASFKAPAAAAAPEAAAGNARGSGSTRRDGRGQPTRPKVKRSTRPRVRSATPRHGGAPKVGDNGGLGPRVAQGYATLYNHAITGIRGMPPKGGNPVCRGRHRQRVGYMFSESGGKL